MTDDYKRVRDAAAPEFDGTTCSVGMRSSWKQGFDHAHLHSPVILALVEKLNSIIAKSHSWVITRETGAIEKPIHEAYRALAQSALADYNKLRENL